MDALSVTAKAVCKTELRYYKGNSKIIAINKKIATKNLLFLGNLRKKSCPIFWQYAAASAQPGKLQPVLILHKYLFHHQNEQ